MGDAVLVVAIAVDAEAQALVERGQPRLGADADGVARPALAVEGDPPAHEFPAEAQAAARVQGMEALNEFLPQGLIYAAANTKGIVKTT